MRMLKPVVVSPTPPSDGLAQLRRKFVVLEELTVHLAERVEMLEARESLSRARAVLN